LTLFDSDKEFSNKSFILVAFLDAKEFITLIFTETLSSILTIFSNDKFDLSQKLSFDTNIILNNIFVFFEL